MVCLGIAVGIGKIDQVVLKKTGVQTDIKQAALTYAQNYLVSPGGGASLTEDDITITRDLGGDGIFNVGDTISVRIDYDFNFLLIQVLAKLGVLESLPAETVMFAE